MKTPIPEQIQAALNEVGKGFNENPLLRTSHAETIQFALRFTAKMMEEPSDGMAESFCDWVDLGFSNETIGKIFKAMRDQAIREIAADSRSAIQKRNHDNWLKATEVGKEPKSQELK